MNVAVQLEPADGAPAEVEFRWDTDTDILTARLRNGPHGQGMSGSVELSGADGSWVILDVKAGSIAGVEVAVWPEVRKVPTLSPPPEIDDARVVVPERRSQPGIALLSVDTKLHADADEAERTIHFTLDGSRAGRTVRIARDVLLDLDDESVVTGLWLLNVPPFPTAE
ncbi:MAG: hypothetical protein M3081_18445 [Gemmatimonadota bacterium]|nr:hypothetical protein [Gemmatimonadota bacterium]